MIHSSIGTIEMRILLLAIMCVLLSVSAVHVCNNIIFTQTVDVLYMKEE